MKQINTDANAVNFNEADDYIEPAMRQTLEIHHALNELRVLNWYDINKCIQLDIEQGVIQISDDQSLPKNVVVINGEYVRKDVWDAISSKLSNLEKTHRAEMISSRTEFEFGMDIGKLIGLRWVIGDEWDGDLLQSDSTDECEYSESDFLGENLESFALSPETVIEIRPGYMIGRNIMKLTDLVWYNRHMGLRQEIEDGLIKIIEPKHYNKPSKRKPTIQRDVLNSALQAARDVEFMYGVDSLGPWTDLEWGILNGKLSALRWVAGDEWDQLDT